LFFFIGCSSSSSNGNKYNQYAKYIPQKQLDFINIIEGYKKKYNTEKNEMKKTIMIRSRKDAIYNLFPKGLYAKDWKGLYAKAWVGIVLEVAQTKSSKDGVIEIQLLGSDIVVGPMINDEKVNSNYTIPQWDPLFLKIADLKRGDCVLFYGEFPLNIFDKTNLNNTQFFMNFVNIDNINIEKKIPAPPQSELDFISKGSVDNKINQWVGVISDMNVNNSNEIEVELINSNKVCYLEGDKHSISGINNKKMSIGEYVVFTGTTENRFLSNGELIINTSQIKIIQ